MSDSSDGNLQQGTPLLNEESKRASEHQHHANNIPIEEEAGVTYDGLGTNLNSETENQKQRCSRLNDRMSENNQNDIELEEVIVDSAKDESVSEEDLYKEVGG